MPKKTDIPEPPKFNLKDLPAPPKLDSPDNPEIHDKNMDVPSPDSGLPAPTTHQMDAKPKKEEVKSEISEPVVVKNDLKKEVDLLPNPPNLDEIPDMPKEKKPKKEKKGFFGMFGGKKKVQQPELIKKEELPQLNLDSHIINEELPKPLQESKEELPVPPNFNDVPELKKDLPEVPSFEPKKPNWLEEGEKFREEEMVKEAESFKEKEMVEEAQEFITKTPLSKVKGVGPARAKKLKKAGFKTAEHLAVNSHKHIAKKTKIPLPQVKKIVTHAKKITKIKAKLKKQKKADNISEVIKQLEQERKTIDRLKKGADTEEKVVELEGHKEIVTVLNDLKKKRDELFDLQKELAEKDNSLKGQSETYQRDMSYIDKLKRRLDHDVRERTQYLIKLERDYFEKAQKLSVMQSKIEVKEKTFTSREKDISANEKKIKNNLNDLEDREITIEAKETKLNKIMEQFDNQDTILREKEENLIKKEAEYLKKLDILETHEKSILKNLEERRASLQKKEKEIELRESRLHKEQRTVDKKKVAVEYAKDIMQEEKSKLVDDEFEQYLHDQLRGISGINIHDVNTVQNLKIPNLGDKNRSVYQLIDSCKEMLQNNKVSEAKVYYNQLRDRYYTKSFPNQAEKESIHNMIRALYDEINLADIGTNR